MAQDYLWSDNVRFSGAFIQNMGQFDPMDQLSVGNIQYGIDQNQFHVLFDNNGFTYRYDTVIRNPKRKEDKSAAKRLTLGTSFGARFIGGNLNPVISSNKEVASSFIYGVYTSSDHTAAKSVRALGYEEITYKEVYPNIDFKFEIHAENGFKYSVLLHPGAKVEDIKLSYESADLVFVDNEGNLVVTKGGHVIREKKPFSFYVDGIKIKSSFKVEGKTVSFELKGYDNSKEAVIDPWVITPSFNTSNAVWEVEHDASGNVYAIGGETPMKLRCYDASGNLQWTYNTPWDTNNYWLGTMATDDAGNTYITAGTSPEIEKIDNAGNMTWHSVPGGLLQTDEFWTITFNCDQSKLLVGGTTADALLDLKGAVFDIDITNGNVSNTVALMAPRLFPGPNEVRCMSASKNGKYYFLTHDTVGAITQNLGVCPTDEPYFLNDAGMQLGYKCENFLPETQNGGGLKALVANDQYFYTHRGDLVEQRSLVDGSIINTAAIPSGGRSTIPFVGGNTIENSGIDIDDQGNVYCGSKGLVVKYDANLNQLSTSVISFTAYDVDVNANGEILVVGAERTNSSTNRIGTIAAVNMTGGNPYQVVCCDATMCPINDLCVTDGPISIQAASPGGTFSGTGVDGSGNFDPALAGEGTHIITYTIACGSDQLTIVVDPCVPIDVCQSGGSYTATGGDNNFTWYEYTTGSVTYNDCASCGGFSVPFIGCTETVPCTVTTTDWIEVGTGSSIPSSSFSDPANNQIKVVDGLGAEVVFADESQIISCGSCTAPVLTVQPLSDCQSVNLIDGVVSTGGGTLTYYASQADGSAGVNALSGNGITASGSYYVRSQDPSDGTCFSIEEIVVAINPLTVTVVSNDPSDCNVADGSIVITVPTANSNYTVSLDGISQGSIQAIGNTITIGNFSGGDVIVSIDVADDATGCSTSDNTGWSFSDPGAPVVDAGSDAQICPDDQVTLQATTSVGTISWSDDQGNPYLNGDVLTPTATTVYTASAMNGACVGSESITITVNPLPDAGVTASTDTICFGDAVQLTADGAGVTYAWSTGENTQVISVSPPDRTFYQLVVTDLVTGCTNDSVVEVYVVDQPVVTITTPGPMSVCAGETVVVDATSNQNDVVWIDGTTGLQWTGELTSSGELIVGAVAACGNTDYDTIQVNVIEGPNVDAGPDGTIDEGDSYQINATTDPGTILWAPSSSLSCDDCEDPLASPETTTWYYITVDAGGNCASVDSVLVTVTQDNSIWWPNAITGTGEDCCFGFTAPALADYQLKIYNRWGELVFESTNQTDVWDGSFRGKEVQTGVYSFVMSYTDANSEPQKIGGNITVVR